MLETRQLLVITVIFLHLAWLPNISMGSQISALDPNKGPSTLDLVFAEAKSREEKAAVRMIKLPCIYCGLEHFIVSKILVPT